MSVLKSKRNESSVEFLRVSRDMEVYAIRLADKKPKKHKAFLYDYIIKPCTNIFNDLKIANSIFITDSESYKLRKRYLDNALLNLQILTSQLDVFYELYRCSDGFSNKEMETLSKMSSNCRRLILGVSKFDENCYSKLQQSDKG